MPSKKKSKTMSDCSRQSLYIFVGVVAVFLISAFFVLFTTSPRQAVVLNPSGSASKNDSAALEVSAPAAQGESLAALAAVRATCKDSDGGDDANVAGAARYCAGNLCTSGKDVCVPALNSDSPSNAVMEVFCSTDQLDNTALTSHPVTCGEGLLCQQGACVTPTAACVDSDGGKNNQAWNAGQAKDSKGGNFADACITGILGSVNEAVCNNKSAQQVTTECQALSQGNKPISGECTTKPSGLASCNFKCAQDSDCPAKSSCDLTSGSCVPLGECATDANCPKGYTCNAAGFCALKAALQCSDNDPLNNPYRPGSVSFTNVDGNKDSQADTCGSDTTKVSEYSCKDAQPFENFKTCPTEKNVKGLQVRSTCALDTSANAGKCQFACTSGDDATCPRDMYCGDNSVCKPFTPCTPDGNECNVSQGEQCVDSKCRKTALTRCATNTDCKAHEVCNSKGYCEKELVASCTSNEECSTDGSKTCQLGKCVNAQCTTNAQCASPSTCYRGLCVECTKDDQCASGQVCNENKCVAKQVDCTSDSQCPAESICSTAGKCITECTDTDPNDDTTIKGELATYNKEGKVEGSISDKCAASLELSSSPTNENAYGGVEQYQCNAGAKTGYNSSGIKPCPGASVCLKGSGKCSCVDTDPSGKNDVVGTAYGTNKALTDKCGDSDDSDDEIKEAYCTDSQEARYRTVRCPVSQVCSAGVCVAKTK